jgi:hypothetical protein
MVFAVSSYRVPFLGVVAIAILIGAPDYRKTDNRRQWHFTKFWRLYLTSKSGDALDQQVAGNEGAGDAGDNT